MNTKPVIALDADGVLLDYHEGYARAWEQAFGQALVMVDPHAYWAWDRYGAPRLQKDQRQHLQTAMGEDFWSNLRPMPGAVEACRLLRQAGYRLVCVSALTPRYQLARQRNLQELGFELEAVITTGRPEQPSPDALSPKAQALQSLAPAAFVDDYLPYFRGVSGGDIHRALIARGPNGSPNHGEDLRWVDSTHDDLLGFARHWLQGANGR